MAVTVPPCWGGYRLARNGAVKPEAIRAGGFAHTAGLAQGREVLLSVEDSTSVSYPHASASELGLTGGKRSAKRNGFMVHTVLLLDAQSEATVGLVAQRHWCRGPASYGKNHTRKQRAYPDRESYKWGQASAETATRLGAAMRRTVSVCDRKADIYGYLVYKVGNGPRFVVRAQADRRLEGRGGKLFDTLRRDAAALCSHAVAIPQRGGRKARTAVVSVRTATFDILVPAGSAAGGESLRLNAVLAEEVGAPAGVEPLHWVLLTTEAVGDAEAALRVVRYYGLRWRIEEYRKAWKSGVGVERQRFQSTGNLGRMLAVTAFLAVRLLQLKELADKPAQADGADCGKALDEGEWKALWVSTEPGKPLPQTPPPAHWAFYALAKLGGFAGTKRTGRVGWEAVWRGWSRLQERVQGYRLCKSGFAEL